MIHASFFYWAGAAWREGMDVRKEVSPVQRLYRGILGRSPDFPPSDLSHTTFPSVTSHGMLLIPGG